MEAVAVLGCGGVGLPLAVALATRGCEVLGVEIDAARRQAAAEGRLAVEDEGLPQALAESLGRGRLTFSADLRPAAARRAYVIATPTPVDEHGRLVDAPLHTALGSVLQAAQDGELVIVRSTLPIGGLRRLAEAADASGRKLLFAACPDRSIAGRALREQFSTPNLVGGLTPEAGDAACELLGRLGQTVRMSSPEAAEAAKLFANAWRDAQFALANQFAMICEASGIDYAEVRSLGGLGFARFSPPRAGPVGGPCLTKDGRILQQSAAERGASTPLLSAARALNESLADSLVRRILGSGSGGPVTVLGLAFKGRPPTLDRRGSIGVELVEALGRAAPGLELRSWDPASDPPEAGRRAVAGARLVVLANDHDALADATLLAGCADGAVVLDLCGVLDEAPPTGLRLERFGRSPKLRS